MRKKNLTYYLNTFRLKRQALRHRLLQNSSGAKSRMAANQSINVGTFRNWNLDLIFERKPEKFYYSYGHFLQPDDLGSSLLFNKSSVAFSSINNPFSKFVNPLFPAYYGLVCHNHFIQSDSKKSLAAFWKQVEFLQDFGHSENGRFNLPYKFDFPAYGIKAPWQAGITQALAASLFLRAHWLKPNKGYGQLGMQCLELMWTPKAKGGLSLRIGDGHLWIEEFPSPQPSLVLNGFIFCLIASIEYAQQFKQPAHIEQAQLLLESFMNRFHLYQYSPHLRHDLKHWNLSNLEYQGLYVFLFIHLHRLTGKRFFFSLARKLEQAFSWTDFMYFYQMPARKIDLDAYKIESEV